MKKEDQKAIDKRVFEDDLAIRTKERIDKIKNGKAYLVLLTNPDFLKNKKKVDKEYIAGYLNKYDILLPNIEVLIRKMHNNVDKIWDQNKLVAEYLLIGKVFLNLKAILLLAKNGYCFEVMDLVRAGQESLDLAFLLGEDGQQEQLGKWFCGKIVDNGFSREVLDCVINKDKEISKTLPLKRMKVKIYRTLSLFTHSSYSALLDEIDVFNEDFDFKKYSGFHYVRKNLNYVDNLAINLVLQLKYVFAKSFDLNGIDQTDVLLKDLGHVDMSKDEIDLELTKHKLN